eukprot:c15898_g1_i2.p1 GENE.c15898_g1_i2~~c15898_g1_i2.p1  ORF type:complete len:261 (-),score=99.75 c15898_g1_i2:18-800(-)
MCLLCGYIGCGRYSSAHAIVHYEESSHAFAYEISEHSVWNYVSDKWAHRLHSENNANNNTTRILNNDELRDIEQNNIFESLIQSKIGYVSEEYKELLESQLEKQRLYFDQQFHQLCSSCAKKNQPLKDEVENLESQLKQIENSTNQFTQDKSILQRKIQTQTSQINKLKTDLEKLRIENEALAATQKEWQTKMEQSKADNQTSTKDARISELKEQISDLEFALKTHKAVKKSHLKGDIAEGVILMTEQSPVKKNTHKKKK